jgi:hypothetical protein
MVYARIQKMSIHLPTLTGSSKTTKIPAAALAMVAETLAVVATLAAVAAVEATLAATVAAGTLEGTVA